jgi:hypothetical protein
MIGNNIALLRIFRAPSISCQGNPFCDVIQITSINSQGIGGGAVAQDWRATANSDIPKNNRGSFPLRVRMTTLKEK